VTFQRRVTRAIMKLVIASIWALVIILNAEAKIALIQGTNGEVLGPYLIKPIDHAHQDDDKSVPIPLGLTDNVYRDYDGSETNPIEPIDNVHQDDDKTEIIASGQGPQEDEENETIPNEAIDNVPQTVDKDEIIISHNKKLHPTNTDLAEDYDINKQPSNNQQNSWIDMVPEIANDEESLEMNATNLKLINAKLDENTCMSNCTNFTRNHTQLEVIAGNTNPQSYFNITEDDPERTLMRYGSFLQLICYAEKMSETESDVNITFTYESANSSSLPDDHHVYPSQNTTHHISLLTVPQLGLNESGFFTCKVNVNCCNERTSVSVQHSIEVWDGDMSREIGITAGIAASLAGFWALVTYLMSRRQKEKKKRFIKNVLIPSSLNDSNTLKSRVILMSRSNESLDSFE